MATLTSPKASGKEQKPGADPRKDERTPRVIEAEALFLGAQVVHIRHAGELYTLRVTRAGKLILTK